MIIPLSKEEKDLIEAAHLISKEPLRIRSLPAKEKRKVHLFSLAAQCFEPDRVYTEAEVNAVLIPIYEDYVMLRRYLIDYRYLTRNPSGSQYRRVEEANNTIK
jgi:hypothetical protein